MTDEEKVGQMRAAVRLIDYLLRVSQRLYEYSADPRCILRVQLRGAPHTVNIAGEEIRKDEPVLALHLWNDRMPKLPSGGPTLEWALGLRRDLIYSFGQLAQVVLNDDRYSQVRALCGSSALLSFTGHTGGTLMLQRLGFTVLPYQSSLGKFGEFWENLFSWWLMWTYNEPSLQSRKFWLLQRTEIWMLKEEFLHRYRGASR